MREQISRVANNTSVHPNNSTLSDVSQVQPGQPGNNAVSEPCTSNSLCMIENIWIGCSHGMNGNALSGNVCSMTPTTCGGQSLPELSLPTCCSTEQSAVNFFKNLDEYLKLKSVDEHLKLTLVSKSLTEKFAKNLFMVTKGHINSYEEFKITFFINFGVKNHSLTQGHRFIDVGMINLQTALWLHIF